MANLTSKAIKEALDKLLSERPLSQITVKDIVTECGINRNTFYYHYQGIPELIAEMVNDEAEAVIQSHPTVETLEDGLEAILRAALRKKRTIYHIYNSANRDIYEQYLWNVCEHVVGTYLDTVLNGRRLPDDDRSALCMYFTCVAYGVVSRWLATGMKESMIPILRRFGEFQRGSLEEMIARSIERKK